MVEMVIRTRIDVNEQTARGKGVVKGEEVASQGIIIPDIPEGPTYEVPTLPKKGKGKNGEK